MPSAVDELDEYLNSRVPGLTDSAPVLVNLASVKAEPVEWLWPGRIPRGKLALIIGEPGDGKTMTLCDVTARVTRGIGWPDGGDSTEGHAIILTAEDGIADTLRPRIDRHGGDAAHVDILRGVRLDGAEIAFNLERDLPALEHAITSTGSVIVGIDPLSAYLGSRDSYKDSEIRGILGPLAALAERTRVAVVGILHLTKAAQRRLLNRAQGSIAFVAAARVVLSVGQDPNVPGRRLLVSIKNNLGPQAPALAFRITEDGLRWDAEPVVGSADALLAQDEAPTRSESKEREQAAEFLRQLLNGGPVASKQVEADAKANGIAQRTLWRAKSDLGILAERGKSQEGKPAAWYWMLPPPEFP